MNYTESEVDQDDEELDSAERNGKRDRPGTDKSADPLYQRVTVYLPKPLYQRIRRRMENDKSRGLSQIITAGVIRELKATSPRKNKLNQILEEAYRGYWKTYCAAHIIAS